MKKCVWCNKRMWLRFLRNPMVHDSHLKCNKSWHLGYEAAMNFAALENRLCGIPSANEMYHDRMRANWELDLIEESA